MGVLESSSPPASRSAFLEPVSSRRLGDEVYARLIDAIATNRLAEGMKIQEDELVAQLGVSKTPIREALRRLQAEGFLVAGSHHTPEVRRLEPSDVAELYDLREYLERLAVRRAAEQRDAGALAAIDTLQAAAEERLARGGLALEDSFAYNRDFHGFIFEAAANARLRRLYHLISVDVRRLAYRAIRAEGRQRMAIEQHREILEAVCAGAADRAEKLIAQHIRTGRADVLAQFETIRQRHTRGR